MIKKGFIVTIIFIISTFIQLASQIIVTRLFGAHVELDIFLAAVAIPTVAVTIIYSTLNDVLLPFMGEIKIKQEADKESYYISYTTTLTFVSFLIALVLTFFATPIAQFMYAGKGPEFIHQTSLEMQYLFFGIPIAVLVSCLGSYYYLHKNFTRFPLAQLLGTVFNLILVVGLYPTFGIWALIIAFVLNLVLQIPFVFPKEIFKGSFRWINVLPFLLSWLPLMLGAFASRADTLLIRTFAAYLPTGYFVYLNLISKIFSIATSVMTIGIQVMLLPHLVEYIHTQKYDEAVQSVNKAKILSIFISIAVTVTLILFAPFAINLLFVGGKFTAKDAQITNSLLPLFILPAIGWGISAVFFQPLLALKKGVHVGILNVVALVIAWLVATIVNRYAGALPAITTGLIVLLFIGISGSEILWQYYKKKLMSSVL